MIDSFKDKVAVITGAASGLGRAFAKKGAALGMKLVLADIDKPMLEARVSELLATGAQVMGVPTDVSDSAAVQALADHALEAYGKTHLLFNNAGVGTGGFIWEHSENDWAWVLGVNVMGVAHGVRAFVPNMLRQNEPAHIVNTASIAGLLSPPSMGVYNASKHAVVALTETLYQDLRHVSTCVSCSLLCPAFVPTNIAHAQRTRPTHWRNETEPTPSQLLAAKQIRQAVRAGELSADDIADITFDAVRERRFYIFTHPHRMENVRIRHEDIEELRAPTSPVLQT